MRLSTRDYKRLYNVVFDPSINFPGYRPEVQEAPDGDFRFDKDKHYAHIAAKYLEGYKGPEADFMWDLLTIYTEYAEDCAIKLGLPNKWWPTIEDSTIRILAYPPGALSLPHYDFDLLTLPMYRNLPENYEILDMGPVDRYTWIKGGAVAEGFHYGELATLVNEEYKPTKHQVHADAMNRTQYAAVFFAMPRMDVTLPNGRPVREWVRERKAHSRTGRNL